MFAIVLRNVIGYAIQILPCAVLCLAPFTDKLLARNRSIALAAAILLIGLVPFLLVACGPLPEGLADLRLLMQNLVFLAVVGCLLALYLRAVDAPLGRKLFAFLLVMCYGAIVTQANEGAIVLLGLGRDSDGYMYPPAKLASLCAVNIVLLVPMARAMRHVGVALEGIDDNRLLRRLSAIPICLLVVMVAVGWLPTAWFSDEQVYWLMLLALVAFAVALFLLMPRVIRDALRERASHAELVKALERSERERMELSSQLTARDEQERKRAEQAESRLGPKRPVAISTASKTMTFPADEVLYVESINRSRVIHLADGSSTSVGIPLAQVAEKLPKETFLYCHRSFVVNIDHVRSVSREGLLLDSGQKLPIGRSHYAELREAVSWK